MCSPFKNYGRFLKSFKKRIYNNPILTIQGLHGKKEQFQIYWFVLFIGKVNIHPKKFSRLFLITDIKKTYIFHIDSIYFRAETEDLRTN